MEQELNELLIEVNNLFPTVHMEKVADSFSFELSRFRRGFWCFSVVDDWHKWLDKKLETKFCGNTPQEAIKEFLTYVAENSIEVEKLTSN